MFGGNFISGHDFDMDRCSQCFRLYARRTMMYIFIDPQKTIQCAWVKRLYLLLLCNIAKWRWFLCCGISLVSYIISRIWLLIISESSQSGGSLDLHSQIATKRSIGYKQIFGMNPLAF